MRVWHIGLVCAAQLAGCNAVLGIEDLQVKPDAGSGMISGSSEKGEGGNTSAPGGRGGAGGTGGRAVADDVAGRAAGEGGSGGARDAGGAGGASGDAAVQRDRAGGQPSAGAGGASGPTTGAGGAAAGSGGSADPVSAGPVSGVVIDYRNHVLPDVSVRIGDKETTTDAAGRFSFDAAPGNYDVTLRIQTSVTNSSTTFVWQFQGLTRRDPTLQVYRGARERFGEVVIHAENVTFPLESTQQVNVTFSTPDGDFSVEPSTPETDFLSPYWIGPETTTGVAHALHVSLADGKPSQYLAHDAQMFSLTANMPGQVTFDLTPASIATAALSGSVSGPVIGQQTNEVYLRFEGETLAMRLINDFQAGESFMYNVPTLPKSSFTVVASALGKFREGLAAAYQEASDPGQAALALKLPTLPTLLTPDDAKVNADLSTTAFQWMTDAKVSVLCVNSVERFDAVCVVTQAKSTKLPVGNAFGYVPAANANFEWHVEVHDDYASVDAACSPTGFLSAYATGKLAGPRRGPGHYAESVLRGFTTPP